MMVFCVFKDVPVGKQTSVDILVSIHATEQGADKEAKKRNAEKSGFYFKRFWNVQP